MLAHDDISPGSLCPTSASALLKERVVCGGLNKKRVLHRLEEVSTIGGVAFLEEMGHSE